MYIYIYVYIYMHFYLYVLYVYVFCIYIIYIYMCVCVCVYLFIKGTRPSLSTTLQAATEPTAKKSSKLWDVMGCYGGCIDIV